MDHVRMRDNNSRSHPLEDPTAPFDQISPLLSTPNEGEHDAEDPSSPSPPSPPANSQHSDEKSWFSSLQSLRLKLADLRIKPPRSQPLIRGFERPRFSRIAILAVLCLITYPAFYILTLVAKDRSLFIVRLIVSVWCSGVGFALGYILLTIGAQHLEAASEFTLVEYRDPLILYFK